MAVPVGGEDSRDRELRDHAFEEWDEDLVICFRVARATGEQRVQQNHWCWIRSLFSSHPHGLGREGEVDVPLAMLHHAVEGHLNVPQSTCHEAPTRECDAIRGHVDFMLLSLAAQADQCLALRRHVFRKSACGRTFRWGDSSRTCL